MLLRRQLYQTHNQTTLKLTLCKTDEIADPGSRGFEIKSGDSPLSLFVICKDNQFYAYLNSCPHTGVNLEWLEDQFLDMDNAFIQCSTHDALFEIDSGYCIAGPCAGDSLTPVTLEINNNIITAIL